MGLSSLKLGERGTNIFYALIDLYYKNLNDKKIVKEFDHFIELKLTDCKFNRIRLNLIELN